MGLVVLARHVKLDQTVAIKMLRPEARQRPGVVARFAREARAAAKLKSDHVVRIYDVDEDDDGTPFFVMEHLTGTDLEQVSSEEGPLEVARAVDYVLQACEAVAEAHALGMVHRDLKPANLFLVRKRDGRAIVKLLDFGISKTDAQAEDVALTSPAAILGSPLYMSPEQLKSTRDVDGRTDIWSLGVVLYQLLAGELPFSGKTATALAAQIASDAPHPLRERRPEIAPELAAAVERCLSKEPTDRFENALELARALAPFAATDAKAASSRLERVARAAIVDDPALGATQPADETAEPAVGSARVTETFANEKESNPDLAKTTGSPSARSVPPADTRPSQQEASTRARPRWWIAAVPVAIVVAGALYIMRGQATDGRPSAIATEAAAAIAPPPPSTAISATESAARIDPPAADAAPTPTGPTNPVRTGPATAVTARPSTPTPSASARATAASPASSSASPFDIKIK